MKEPENRISVERLRYLLNYDSSTGIFTWNNTNNWSIRNGDVAGTQNKSGYINIQLDGYLYRAHRLAWLHKYGVWPAVQIDHKDNVRNHNWVSNLREATRSQNCANIKMRKDNASGYRGVTKVANGKYQSYINANNKRFHLGTFNTKEEAYSAYCKKAKELHGEFSSTGDIK